jgi:hypothetical protein
LLGLRQRISLGSIAKAPKRHSISGGRLDLRWVVFAEEVLGDRVGVGKPFF